MLFRKATILAKVETTYGQDASPNPVSDALLVRNIDYRATGEVIERDFLRDYLSPLPFVRGMKVVDLSFETELKGTGTKGALPSFGWEGQLFRACGMLMSVNAGTSIVFDPTSGPRSAEGTMTLAGLPTADETFQVDTQVFTFKASRSTSGEVTIGTDVDECVQNIATAINTDMTAAVAVGDAVADKVYVRAAADGTAGNNMTFTESVTNMTMDGGGKLGGTRAGRDDFESVTIYLYRDRIFHKILGCRGSFRITGEVGNYLTLAWTMRGVFVAAQDLGPGAPSTSNVTPPVLLSADVTLDAYSPVATRLEIDMANDLGRRLDMNHSTGLREILITGRRPAGSLDPETVPSTDHDFWGKWGAGSIVALEVGPFGTGDGNKIQIQAPTMQYEDLSYADREGILSYAVPFRMAQDQGDDEIKIIFT